MTDTDDLWALSAPFYDLDLEGVDDDVTMYRELAIRQDGPVLELGCGTGRIALPLARAGLTVTGVDLSSGMLDVARAQSDGLPLTFVEADLRTFRVRRKFATVLVPFGTMQHMETARDVADAMATVKRHLALGGIAIIDIENPRPEDLEPGPQPLVAHWTRAWEGGHVTKLVAVEPRPAEGVRYVTFHYDVQPPDGGLRRVSHEFLLRLITAGELELAGRLAGLDMVAIYGDYELSPVTDGADRLVATFEHAQ